MQHSDSGSDRSRSKRLLIVSREFLPSKLVAGQRVGGFSKFLPEHGISVHVVTEGTSRDESACQKYDLRRIFPECPVDNSFVSYVPTNACPSRLALRIRRRLHDIGQGGGIIALVAGAIRKPFSAYAFFTYGEHNDWVGRTVREAIEIAGETPFDAVFASSGGEYWNLGAAHRIARKLRIPLILDFRDGWDWFFGFNGKRSIIYPLMRRFMAHSSLVTGATQSVVDRILQFWPHAPVAVVHNGYDIDKKAFSTGSHTPKRSAVTIGYLGTFWSNPRWLTFREALETISETIAVRFVYRGRNPERLQAEVIAPGPAPIGVTFDIGGLCDRSEIFALYGDLDVVLAASPDVGQPRGAIPVKLIEAIGVAKPFVFLADQSSDHMRDFLRGCDLPYLIADDATTSDKLASFILRAKSQAASERRFFEEYSARHRARELSEILHDVWNGSP